MVKRAVKRRKLICEGEEEKTVWSLYQDTSVEKEVKCQRSILWEGEV